MIRPALLGITAAHRLIWLLLAWCSLGVGLAGLLLPLVPTTPLVLLSAWAAAKGSPSLHRWLQRHHRFGPVLRAWREQGAVTPGAKWLAALALLSSWLILWLLGTGAPVLGGLGLLFAAVLGFVLTRPHPQIHGDC